MNNSLPTVESANLEQYYDVIRQLDPELYLIKLALKETGVNPMVLPKIIRSISNLALGTGYGKVQVIMESRTIKLIQGEEKTSVNEKAVIDR